MSMDKIYLKDYERPSYRVQTIDLEFDLDDTRTHVKSKMNIVREGDENIPLIIDGEELNF